MPAVAALGSRTDGVRPGASLLAGAQTGVADGGRAAVGGLDGQTARRPRIPRFVRARGRSDRCRGLAIGQLPRADDPGSAERREQRVGRQRARQRQDARGSVTVELVLTLPILILMLWFLVYCGRLSDTRLQIEDAAHQAARAASLDRSRSAAAADTRSTAATALSDAGVTCQTVSVAVRGSLQAGSTVRVAVSCTVGLRDLALLQVPGSTTLTAEFASPVDVYRSTTTSAGGDTP